MVVVVETPKVVKDLDESRDQLTCLKEEDPILSPPRRGHHLNVSDTFLENTCGTGLRKTPESGETT